MDGAAATAGGCRERGEAVAEDVEMLAQGSADTQGFVEQHNAGTLAKAKAGEVELPLGGSA